MPTFFFFFIAFEFKGLNGLTTITITHCDNLAHIRKFAFRGLKSLKNLIITNNNRLVRIDAHAFGSLKNLNYLSLAMNNLNEIDGFIFSTSVAIKTIDLLGNPIKV
jgi:Leucine-rich repeat (LRR) protein